MKIKCSVLDRYIGAGDCLYRKGSIQDPTKACIHCDRYKSINKASQEIKPKKEKKKKGVAGKQWKTVNEVFSEEDKLRIKWRWEFVRRSKQYNEDYQKYHKDIGEKEFDILSDPSLLLYDRYRIDGNLPMPDPKQSVLLEDLNDFFNIIKYPYPKRHVSGNVYFIKGNDFHILPLHELGLYQPWQIHSPGSKCTIPVDDNHTKEVHIEEWCVNRFDCGIRGGRFEKLTAGNCPGTMIIRVNIEPHFQKTEIKRRVDELFEEGYRDISAIQGAVLKKKPRRPQLGELKKFIKVYDLKIKNPKITWLEIAREVLPQEIEKNRKGTKEIIHPSTKEKLRGYWNQATYYIEEGGWRNI